MEKIIKDLEHSIKMANDVRNDEIMITTDEASEIAEALKSRENDIIAFASWVDGLSHSNRCTVHTSVGAGLRQLSISELYDRWNPTPPQTKEGEG